MPGTALQEACAFADSWHLWFVPLKQQRLSVPFARKRVPAAAAAIPAAADANVDAEVLLTLLRLQSLMDQCQYITILMTKPAQQFHFN